METRIIPKGVLNINHKEKKNCCSNEAIENIVNIYFQNIRVAVVDNKYIVTENGDVYTVIHGKIRKQSLRKNNNGYLRASLFRHDFYAHRLVAFCFFDNFNNYPEISHEDNDKTNNHVSNLRWCTRQYNNKKIFIDGIRTSDEMRKISKMNHIYPKLGIKEVEEARTYYSEGHSLKETAKHFNVSKSLIESVIHKKGAYKNL